MVVSPRCLERGQSSTPSHHHVRDDRPQGQEARYPICGRNRRLAHFPRPHLRRDNVLKNLDEKSRRGKEEVCPLYPHPGPTRRPSPQGGGVRETGAWDPCSPPP